MAIAHVQGNHAGGSTAAGTVAVTLGATVSSGDVVVGMVSWGTNNPADLTSVTDDKGNSYTILDSAFDNPNAQASASFILGNITNAPQTITAHFASSVSFRTILVDEYSGAVATSNPNDGHTGQSQSGIGTATDAVTSGNITTTKNGDLIWGATYNTATGDSQNAGTGFGQRQQDIVNSIATTEDKLQTTAGLVAATFTDVGSGGSKYTTFVIALSAPPAGASSANVFLYSTNVVSNTTIGGWNPTALSGGPFTFTNNDITVAPSTTHGEIVSTDTFSSGNLYFEFVFVTTPSGTETLRFGNSIAWYGITNLATTANTKNQSGFQSALNTSFVAGDTLCVAVSLNGAQAIWFKKNNTNWNGGAFNDPSKNVGGFPIGVAVGTSCYFDYNV